MIIRNITSVLLLIFTSNIAVAQECAKTFESVVKNHTEAINNRDLNTYISTIAPRTDQMMILPDGSYFSSLNEISDWHKEWFADTSWVFNKSLVRKDERDNWGLVVYKVSVDRKDKAGSPFLVSMLFSPEENGCWYLQHDQNTLIK